MTADAGPLSPEQRRRLAIVADVIVPRWNAMPSASDIDLVGAPLDHVLRIRPDLVDPLRRMLDDLGPAPSPDIVGRLQRERPARFGLLLQVVAGAYYMDRGVMDRLKYTVG